MTQGQPGGNGIQQNSSECFSSTCRMMDFFIFDYPGQVNRHEWILKNSTHYHLRENSVITNSFKKKKKKRKKNPNYIILKANSFHDMQFGLFVLNKNKNNNKKFPHAIHF